MSQLLSDKGRNIDDAPKITIARVAIFYLFSSNTSFIIGFLSLLLLLIFFLWEMTTGKER